MKKLLIILIIPFLSFGQIMCLENLNAEAYCNGNLNYIDFEFDYNCDCGTEFNVVGSGQSFGPFEYGQSYYTLGPLSDEDMICELIVQFCDNNNITAETWGWCDDDMVGCETTVEEGCWEDGEFYCIGCELFLNECEYIECEGPQNWSSIITIDDCGGNDCVDDPEDMLAQYGSSCSELSILGCDADLSAFIPGIGFGISVYEICPETCTDCGSIGIIETINNRCIIKTVDAFGRETNNNKGFNIEIYDDGSIEKKYILE